MKYFPLIWAGRIRVASLTCIGRRLGPLMEIFPKTQRLDLWPSRLAEYWDLDLTDSQVSGVSSLWIQLDEPDNLSITHTGILFRPSWILRLIENQLERLILHSNRYDEVWAQNFLSGIGTAHRLQDLRFNGQLTPEFIVHLEANNKFPVLKNLAYHGRPVVTEVADEPKLFALIRFYCDLVKSLPTLEVLEIQAFEDNVVWKEARQLPNSFFRCADDRILHTCENFPGKFVSLEVQRKIQEETGRIVHVNPCGYVRCSLD